MPIGKVEPPSVRPDDEPLICVTLNRQWLSYLIGAILPMKYPEYWAGTLEENRQARRDYGTLLDQLMQESECDGMTTCCTPPYVIQRVNPDTGVVEISTNNGASWSPQPNSIPSSIVEPIPPVTSGVSVTKCDAVANVMVGVNDWITHVTNDFDTAADLLAFASAVLEAILAAIVAILSLGTLTAIEAAVLPLIGAACAAVFTAGKTAFIDYWTDAIKKQIKCALYNNIGDNGAFTDAQFSAYWNDINLNMTGGVPKPLFMGFMSSIGRQGLNNMAASGTSAGASCAECLTTCEMDNWVVGAGTEISRDATSITVQCVVSDGAMYAICTTHNKDLCCKIVSGVTSGWNVGGIPCGEEITGENIVPVSYGTCVSWIDFSRPVSGSPPGDIVTFGFDKCDV